MTVAALTLPGVSKDLAAGLSASDARWLVDYYYSVQDFRIQADGQARAISQDADAASGELAGWLGDAMGLTEKRIQQALDIYSSASAPGQWAKSIIGIGPVIAAGYLAHIDIEKAPSVGHIWAFAGLDPNRKWEKGMKRPWNAKLKVLCWKTGDSFVKFHNHPRDTYGQVYVARKALELERNEQGLFAEQAAQKLIEKKIQDKGLRETLEAGRLPLGQLENRARRYAVKLFLAHLHHVMFESHFGEPPPKPYMIEHHGHIHFSGPPNWPL